MNCLAGGDSLDKSIQTCWYLCRRAKLYAFKALILPVLLYTRRTKRKTVDGKVKKKTGKSGDLTPRVLSTMNVAVH